MIGFHISKTYPNFRKFKDIYLYQIGRLLGTDQTEIPAHAQMDYFELTIVTNGKGKIYTNNVVSNVKVGDIYLSLPGDIHKIESSKEEPLDFDFFSFKTDNPDYLQKLEDVTYYMYNPTMRIFRDEKISFLISNAIMEMENENNYSERLLECIFNQAVLYMIRDTHTGKASVKNAQKNKSEALCVKVMNYIDTHIYSLKNLTDITKIINYDYSYISSLFKKTTGRTLSRYFQNIKLETAKQLLLENKLKVSEIAYLLNYSSLYSFSKAFKDKYGVSPKGFIYSKAKQN